MLPYTSGGSYSGAYGRKKSGINASTAVTGLAALIAIAALGFAFHSSSRASSARVEKDTLSREMEDLRSDLRATKSKYTSRNAEYEHLEATHGHAQRRLTEVTNQLQRKEAELVGKDQTLQAQITERNVLEQHRGAREAELSKMVEDLRKELIRSDGVIDALEKKTGQMEQMHTVREEDWHKLANTWVMYEKDLHNQYSKCLLEMNKLRNETMKANTTDPAPLPEAEPKVRPETDFAHIGVEVPAHTVHKFDPLPVPSPLPSPAPGSDLPLSQESKIRESIVRMTEGKVGMEPGQAVPKQAQGQEASEGKGPGEHSAPSDVHHHHGDIYHGDFHGEEGGEGEHHVDHYGGTYDHDNYHGHYDTYDPMDAYWLKDGHGDWNADDGPNPDDPHGGHDPKGAHDPHFDPTHHNDAHNHGGHQDQHQQQHHGSHHDQEAALRRQQQQQQYHGAGQHQQHGAPHDVGGHGVGGHAAGGHGVGGHAAGGHGVGGHAAGGQPYDGHGNRYHYQDQQQYGGHGAPQHHGHLPAQHHGQAGGGSGDHWQQQPHVQGGAGVAGSHHGAVPPTIHGMDPHHGVAGVGGHIPAHAQHPPAGHQDQQHNQQHNQHAQHAQQYQQHQQSPQQHNQHHQPQHQEQQHVPPYHGGHHDAHNQGW